jgi:ribose transport system ATP-binding protein
MIAIRGLSKSFAGVRVLFDVDVEILDGEVHALVGANGSGKSTVVKSLAGYHPTVDSGELLIDETVRPLPLKPAEVHKVGIRLVHQDLGLVNEMTVADNICLYAGYSRSRVGRIQSAGSRRHAQKLLDELGLEVSPDALVRTLGPTERIIVAVARATATNGRSGTLVLDEPTAAIPAADIARIVRVVRSRRDAGWGVLYISHRLDEVIDLASRVTVLRDGRVILATSIDEVDAGTLSDLIVGDSDDAPPTRSPPVRSPAPDARGAKAAEVRDIAGSRLHGVSLAVGAGETLGVTGPTGCGKSELGRFLVGAAIPIAGSMAIGGSDVRFRHPRDALAAGVAHTPQDRAGLALLTSASIRENVSGLRFEKSKAGGRVSRARETENTSKWIDAFNIVPPDPERTIQTLSGGNQQKAVLARAAQSATRLLVLDDPTAGVDVGARAQIHSIIRELAASGLGVLVLSTEIDELVEICDRVLVLRRGGVTAELRAPIDPEGLARAIYAGQGS